ASRSAPGELALEALRPLAEDLEHRLDHGAGHDAGAEAAEDRADPEGHQACEPQTAGARDDPTPHVLVDLLGDEAGQEAPAAEDRVPAHALPAERLADDLGAALAAEHSQQHETSGLAVGHDDAVDVGGGEGAECAGLRVCE